MKRIKGFEWEDQPWFPHFIRQYMMDFLRFVLNTGNLYQPITPLLADALAQTGSQAIVDLCSGGGGTIPVLQTNLTAYTGKTIPFILTDLYPNQEVISRLQNEPGSNLCYHPQPVSATGVPPNLQGFRTMFSAFHHFEEATAKKVLQNAVDAGEGIAIFDGGSRSLWFILTILLFQPVAFLLFTPFIKPFSIGRLLFTYILPVVPFCTVWDGIVSVLRLYTYKDMLYLSHSIEDSGRYAWLAGRTSNGFGIPIAYLIGCPAVPALFPS